MEMVEPRDVVSDAIAGADPIARAKRVGLGDEVDAHSPVRADAGAPARVFDVAWRSGAARTPGADIGAGLGLAIVTGLVEAHHGTVTVRNHHPGCRFVVTIPG